MFLRSRATTKITPRRLPPPPVRTAARQPIYGYLHNIISYQKGARREHTTPSTAAAIQQQHRVNDSKATAAATMTRNILRAVNENTKPLALDSSLHLQPKCGRRKWKSAHAHPPPPRRYRRTADGRSTSTPMTSFHTKRELLIDARAQHHNSSSSSSSSNHANNSTQHQQ